MTLLVAGLGNPGERYAQTRHNVGWMFIDRLAQANGAQFRSTSLAMETEFRCRGERVVALKPLTFMNLSGKAIAPRAQAERVPIDRVLVVSDEVQMELGRIKLSTGGSDGGHNGLASIIASLGTPDFRRLRIGVGPRSELPLADFVLSSFTTGEAAMLDRTLERSLWVFKVWSEGGGSSEAFARATAESNRVAEGNRTPEPPEAAPGEAS